MANKVVQALAVKGFSMKEICEYPIYNTGETSFRTHVGAQILGVEAKEGVIYIKALVDKSNRIQDRYINVVRTNHQLGTLIGTIQLQPFKWNVHIDE